MGMEEQELANSAASELESFCSTPYLSAASSPARDAPFAGFYYSAPASPTHFVLSATGLDSYTAAAAAEVESSSEFDFFAKFPTSDASLLESMTSADELFFNGQIRPVKLSTHLQRPQILVSLTNSDVVAEEDQALSRGREQKLRTGSLRRRARSMSPHRTADTSSLVWQDDVVPAKRTEDGDSSGRNGDTNRSKEKTPPASGRWVFLKEFLYRSKSEGRNEGHKFWSFSPGKDKKPAKDLPTTNTDAKKKAAENNYKITAAGKRGIPPPSAHELHYTAKRAQAEEMRKRTFLPYRQGLLGLGCLGFKSRSYGAMSGFARAFNPAFKIRS